MSYLILIQTFLRSKIDLILRHGKKLLQILFYLLHILPDRTHFARKYVELSTNM